MTLELLYAITHADDKTRVEDLHLSCKPKRLTTRHFMEEWHAAFLTICNASASQRYFHACSNTTSQATQGSSDKASH